MSCQLVVADSWLLTRVVAGLRALVSNSWSLNRMHVVAYLVNDEASALNSACPHEYIYIYEYVHTSSTCTRRGGSCHRDIL